MKIYTTNFGDYDVLHDPACMDHEYVCFTDRRARSIGGGLWRPVVRPVVRETPRREARWHKMHSHELFPHADWTLWVDASLQLRRCPEDFLSWRRAAAEGGERDVYLFAHPERDCLYREADACIAMSKDTREKIAPQVERYRAMAFPERHGLWQSGVLCRRNTPAVTRFNEMWWWEIVNGSHRDQISLPVVLTFSGVTFGSLPHEALTDWFTWRADHGGKPGRNGGEDAERREDGSSPDA